MKTIYIIGSYFIRIPTSVNITMPKGLLEITDSLFYFCHSITLPPVFFIKFDDGFLGMENVIAVQCTSEQHNQIFEFISDSEKSYASLSRLSFCKCGMKGRSKYTHSAVIRCKTSAFHINSSYLLSSREAGLYMPYTSGEQNAFFIQYFSCYAEDDIIENLKGKATISRNNFVNCTSAGDQRSIMCFDNDVTVEYSNFLRNNAKILTYGGRLTIKNCFCNTERKFGSEIIFEQWVDNCNFVSAMIPFISTKQSTKKMRVFGILVFFILLDI